MHAACGRWSVGAWLTAAGLGPWICLQASLAKVLTPIQTARILLSAYPYNPGGLLKSITRRWLCCPQGARCPPAARPWLRCRAAPQASRLPCPLAVPPRADMTQLIPWLVAGRVPDAPQHLSPLEPPEDGLLDWLGEPRPQHDLTALLEDLASDCDGFGDLLPPAPPHQ